MQEDIRCHDEKVASGGVQSDTRKWQREETMRRWQDQWTTDAGQPGAPGLKTRRLIPDINLWVGRKHGEVDFFHTQLLTERGFLRSYFVEKGILDGSPNCPECGDAVEDVEHVLFRCPRFYRERDAAAVPFPREVPYVLGVVTNDADPPLSTRSVGDRNPESASHHGKQRKKQNQQTSRFVSSTRVYRTNDKQRLSNTHHSVPAGL
uniref:Reverse transcriptase zinc-binding domain-containing protein n=1 Tax=Anopheles merus TaxID=30066 RepID=A0A182UNX4_ANOME